MKTKTTVRYFTRNMDCLENGSFLRQSKYGISRFINGDFMGFVDKVFDDLMEVDKKTAESKIPKCCL